MAPRHPCPNCGKLRQGPDAPCAACYFPKHERKPDERIVIVHPPLQFHIRTLLTCMIIAAIVCAILKKSGTEGLWLTLDIMAIFAPFIEFAYYLWINLRSKNRRDS